MNSVLGEAGPKARTFTPLPFTEPACTAVSAIPAISFAAMGVVYAARRRRDRAKVAVKSLDLQVAPGEVFGFLGPNGAGKTTTMNVLLGFVQPTRGRAEIFGVDAAKPESRSALGYLPELTYYYKFLTGRELLRFYAKLFGMATGTAEARIKHLLALVEMEEAADKLIRSYSKGMQQRIGLAQALINDPRLLVLDEPTSGLDPVGRMKVRNIIQRLKDEGKTVFFSSHELGEVETVCDRVAIFNEGEVKVTGSVSELMAGYGLNLEQIFLRVVGYEEER